MRSDIYSLGVIAYQMLAGEPPFSGNTSAVMRAHREDSPRHVREHARKIPKRVARRGDVGVSKSPTERPATAFAFGSALRGQTDGVGALYRRAFSLYSEYFPKFLKLSFIAHIPVIVTTILMSGSYACTSLSAARLVAQPDRARLDRSLPRYFRSLLTRLPVR